jgi:hypothetical protein
VEETIANESRLAAVGKARRLADYSDLLFFSLGAVYTAAAVPFDIVADYISRCVYDGPRLVLQFNHALLVPIAREWAVVLEGIHKDRLPELTKFMVTQTVLRRSEREYWEIGYQDVDIPDPFAIQQHNLREGEPRPSVRIFLPSGNKYRLGLHRGVANDTPYTLLKLPPLVETMQRAQAVLTVVP